MTYNMIWVLVIKVGPHIWIFQGWFKDFLAIFIKFFSWLTVKSGSTLDKVWMKSG